MRLTSCAQPAGKSRKVGKARKAGKDQRDQRDQRDQKDDGWRWKDRDGERYRRYREAEALSKGLHRIYDRLKEALETDPPPQAQKRDRLARYGRYGRRALQHWLRREYRSVSYTHLTLPTNREV